MDTERNAISYPNRLSRTSAPPTVEPVSASQPAGGDGDAIDLTWLGSVFMRRLPVMIFVSFLLSGLSAAAIFLKGQQTEVSYDGSFQMLIEPVTAEGRLAKLSLLAQTGTNVGATELTKVGVDQADLVDYETQIRVLKSPRILDPVVKTLRTKNPDMTSQVLLSNLTISRIGYVKDGKEVGTKILDVHYKDKDPEQIKFVLDTLSNAYLQYSLEERQSSLNQGLEFINQQLPELQNRVDKFQGQLQKLREQYNLTFPDRTADELSNEGRNLQGERINVQAQLTESIASYNNLEKEIAAGNPISILSRDPNNNYNVLINQLQQVESQIALQASQFKEDSPPMQVLYEKRDNLRALLAREADAARRTLAVKIKDLQAREQYIDNRQQQLDSRLRVFPEVLRQYSDLDRNTGVATETLKTFLEKREALKLDASQREIPWQLIAPPALWETVDGGLLKTSEINKKRLLAIAVILSTLVGIGVGFIIEILNSVYHTPDEVKNGTKLRLLGAIPRAKQLKRYENRLRRLAKGGQPEFLPQPEYSVAFLEAFRSLYTNISLLDSKKSHIHSLAVSSAASGDGKSTIAWQLAQTAASVGQRVLLVDSDLRRPQLHWRLGLTNKQGLSDLIQSDLILNEVIQQSPTEPNLFFLSSGNIPSDPIKLLSSAKMEHLMEQFQGFFDFVVYDTPPLIGLADANLIGAKADGIVFVVNLDKTNRGLVTKAIDGLRMTRATILGVVANGIKRDNVEVELAYLRSDRSFSTYSIPPNRPKAVEQSEPKLPSQGNN
ncbi:polysaccharide biosynthesis tyrosine autokinase [Oscillatoria sp. FACHB-1406]|uniref:GumC family protein n=1 Tax=Oscillatoria sp. FACHB-1406 TaxID=2692846 RepID=UPI001682E3A8|nr:polysaccharide biosynthesis tyrosine autokinase [Oscillatoria sp. FACHB-1406]MBD2577609.1 polysaccharide biosynthesis tyrosine autokinase [Oscillatoria sp. FACHB-1406]